MSTELFRRPLRRQPPPEPKGEIVLESPPELPESVSGAGMGQALTYLPMAAGAGSTALLVTGSGGSPLTYLASGMMALSMLGMAFGSMGRSSGEKRRRLDGDRRDYQRYLEQVRRRVRRAAEQQRAAALWHHPEPSALWCIALGTRLWERRPIDGDFLVGPRRPRRRNGLASPSSRRRRNRSRIWNRSRRCRFAASSGRTRHGCRPAGRDRVAGVRPHRLLRAEAGGPRTRPRDARPARGIPLARRRGHRRLRRPAGTGRVGVAQVVAARPGERDVRRGRSGAHDQRRSAGPRSDVRRHAHQPAALRHRRWRWRGTARRSSSSTAARAGRGAACHRARAGRHRHRPELGPSGTDYSAGVLPLAARRRFSGDASAATAPARRSRTRLGDRRRPGSCRDGDAGARDGPASDVDRDRRTDRRAHGRPEPAGSAAPRRPVSGRHRT